MLINPVFYFVLVLFLIVEVRPQVCIKQVMYTTKVLETYSKSIYEIYGTLTLHSRWRIKVIERYVTKTRVNSTTYCCEGYKKDNYYAVASETTCKPICKSDCSNGYCKHPGVCACNNGFARFNSTDCEPVCEPECEHGTCVAPNVCECHHGYNTLTNATCQPICSVPCHNGICSAPETCECLPGYREILKNDCRPICSHICHEGTCIAPETCLCYPGWSFAANGSESNSCVIPECKKVTCGNGTCVEPDNCLCYPGYERNVKVIRGEAEGPVCEPICTGCKGNCIAPGKCVDDYSKTSNEDTTRTTFAFHPSETISSYYTRKYYFENATTTEQYTTTTAMNNGTTVTEDKIITSESTWIEKHRMFIVVPIAVIVIVAITLLLVWQRIPTMIVNYFRGKSYNVKGARLRRKSSDSFENVQFISNLGDT